MSRRRSKGRNVNGVLLLDKPVGMSSNLALQIVKRLFNANKAGHTGSLDPLASGLLPICFGEATKASGFLLDADKHYRVRCKLGEKTATGDTEGEVIERRPVEGIDAARLETVFAQFRGELEQIPPMYSAVKHQGQRLYTLARQGVEVAREPRRIVIHELTLLGLELPSFDIDVRCTKGTYVRTLAEDIGEALGCGAHVTELRRLGVGPYDAANMVSLDTLKELAAGEGGVAALDAHIFPTESALTQWPDVRLSPDATFYLRQGQAVVVPHAPTSGWVRLYAPDQRFLGMGQILDDGRVAPKRMMIGAG